MTRQKVLIIGDTSNRTNWGCRSTSESLRAMISSRAEIVGTLDMTRIAERIPRAVRVTAVGPLRKTLPARAMRRIGRSLTSGQPGSVAPDLDAEKLDAFADALEAGRIYPHLTKALKSADVVIANGEGSILQSRPSGRVLMGVAYAAATRFGVKVAIVNHTADLRSGMHGVAARVYPHMTDIRVRERLSLAEVSAVAARAPHGFAADAAFAFPGALRPRVSRTRPVIAVGGSAAYHRREPTFDRVGAFRQLCVELAALGDVVVTASSVPDQEFLEPVAESLGLPFWGLRTPTHTAAQLLASVDLYVGGRWHPAILAARGGVPSVLYSSNSENKMLGLCEILGFTQPAFSADDLPRQTKAIVEFAESVLSACDRPALQQVAADMARSALANVSILDA